MIFPPSPMLLDSSVLVKLFAFEEVDSHVALALRDGFLRGEWEIRLADLCFYELANALHYLKKYSTDEIVASVQSLIKLEPKIYEFSLAILNMALELCKSKSISIYDAYLVALAKRENLAFVTADEKLWRKFPHDESVIALREILLPPTQSAGT